MDVSCVESVVIRDPIFVIVNKHEALDNRIATWIRRACAMCQHKRAAPTPKINESDPTSLDKNVDLAVLHRLVRSMSRNSDFAHPPNQGGGEDDTTTTRHDTTRRNSLSPASPDGRLRHPPTRAPPACGNAISRSGHKPPSL